MSNNPADKLLACLEGVRQTGERRWMARCPAHADRSASLSIREADDGRALVHCFAGCSIGDVVGAVRLELHDLFPPRTGADSVPRERMPFRIGDAVRALERELAVVWVLLADIAAGAELGLDARQRAGQARERCLALIEALRRV